jgi:predicted metal-dependent hydrolase
VTVATGRTIVGRDGRAKAYRPLPATDRAAALAAGLAAYERGDFFEAHELLEPAWMGSDDLAERDLLQGLIKLSAAYVHAVRGNPRGIATNLSGARERLAAAQADGRHTAGLDLDALLDAIDVRLAELAARPDHQPAGAPDLRRIDA